MAAITKAALNALAASLLPGGSKATAADMKQILSAMIESLLGFLDDKNAVNGYAGLDANGNINRSQVFSVKTDAGTGLVMDNSIYSEWVSTNGGAVAWTSPGLGAPGANRKYSVVNMGTNNLTINYPGGAAKIVDLVVSVAPVNTIVIVPGRAKTIIDNGTNLIFF